MSSQPSTVACDHCGTRQELGVVKRCFRCKNAHYCNRTCQVQHWPIHKQTCAVNVPTSSITRESEQGETSSDERRSSLPDLDGTSLSLASRSVSRTDSTGDMSNKDSSSPSKGGSKGETLVSKDNSNPTENDQDNETPTKSTGWGGLAAAAGIAIVAALAAVVFMKRK